MPKIKRHTKSTHASSTLATDGSYIVAMLGSEGLFAFDMKGTQLWKKDLGVLDSGWFNDKTAQWAFGSSPIIHEGTIILQADVQQGAFLGAFDLKTGNEKWRTPRADVPTWGTPTIVAGRTASRRSSSTAGNTSAPTTSRPARKSGSWPAAATSPCRRRSSAMA